MKTSLATPWLINEPGPPDTWEVAYKTMYGNGIATIEVSSYDRDDAILQARKLAGSTIGVLDAKILEVA